MPVAKEEVETVDEFLRRAKMKHAQLDRIALLLMQHDVDIPIMPYVQVVAAMDPNRVIKPLFNAAGVFPVTEASAVAIQLRCDRLLRLTSTAKIADLVTTGAVDGANLRIGRAVITVVAGAWANQVLVPALAGYYGVCRIKSVKSNANEVAGAASMTYESPAATPALPSVEVMPAFTANVRRDDIVGCVVTHATVADAQAIVVDGAGWTGTEVTIEWEYWYET